MSVKIVKLTVSIIPGGVAVCAPAGWGFFSILLSCIKRRDVEGVGCVAQSERFAEKFQQKVFRNDDTAYII